MLYGLLPRAEWYSPTKEIPGSYRALVQYTFVSLRQRVIQPNAQLCKFRIYGHTWLERPTTYGNFSAHKDLPMLRALFAQHMLGTPVNVSATLPSGSLDTHPHESIERALQLVDIVEPRAWTLVMRWDCE